MILLYTAILGLVVYEGTILIKRGLKRELAIYIPLAIFAILSELLSKASYEGISIFSAILGILGIEY